MKRFPLPRRHAPLLALLLALSPGTDAPAQSAPMPISADETTAVFLQPDGRRIEVELSSLGGADREMLHQMLAAQKEAAEDINQAAGHPAFVAVPWIHRDAAEIAAAFRLPQESASIIGNSWRLYAAARRPDYRLFGAMPYSVALYSDENGRADSMSIVYANKGDYDSRVGFALDHFNEDGSSTRESLSLDEAMQRDHATIAAALEAALGEGRDQRFGDTGVRRTVRRWDWNEHAFLLTHLEGEYVSVEIVSTAFAEAGGRTARLSNAELRARIEGCVERNEQGDVWIREIPMVDQGPKGYCVPATFERAMRFMGIEADMYLLAMVGQSSAGGGTSVERLLENLKSQVYRKGRRVREFNVRSLRIRDVQRHIDSGVPLLWRMSSMPEYNEWTDLNTRTRHTAEHDAVLERARAAVHRRDTPAANYHLCMIIGYNERTGELAVSDSWGSRFELRWVPVEVADWVNQGALVAIQP